MNFNPFLDLVVTILSLYNNILMVWLIASLLIYFDVINSRQPFVYKLMSFLNKLVVPILDKIKKVVPPIAGVDISVVILYLALRFITNIIYAYFYS